MSLVEKKLAALLCEFAGAASMLWEHPERAGRYLDTEATRLVQQYLPEIQELTHDAVKQETVGDRPTKQTV